MTSTISRVLPAYQTPISSSELRTQFGAAADDIEDIQATLAERVSVTSFGATGNGVTDDWAALQSAFNSGIKHLYFPAGTYMVSATLEMPPTVALRLSGEGKTVSVIRPSVVLAGAVLHRAASASFPIGGGIEHLGVDANKKAAHAIYIETGKGMAIENCMFTNATSSTGRFGSADTPRFYESNIIGCNFSSAYSLFAPSELPDYNLLVEGYATDNVFVNDVCSNAKTAYVWTRSGGNFYIGCHV